MAGYQADTFHCVPLNTQQLVDDCVVAEQFRLTSFFISCNKRLWECVRHFLGNTAHLHQALPVGRSGGHEVVDGGGIRQVAQMLN